MANEYWEIYASDLAGTYEIFDWLMLVSKEYEVPIPRREQEMINWCEEHYGEPGDRWTWAIGIAYMVPSKTWDSHVILENDGDHCPEDIRPEDIIFVFYNQEDAIEFKLVWN